MNINIFNDSFKKANNYKRANFIFNILSVASIAAIAVFSILYSFKKLQTTSMLYAGIALIILSLLFNITAKILTYVDHYKACIAKINEASVAKPYGSILIPDDSQEKKQKIKSIFCKNAAISILQSVLFATPFLIVGILAATKICNPAQFQYAIVTMGIICTVMLLFIFMLNIINVGSEKLEHRDREILAIMCLALTPLEILNNNYNAEMEEIKGYKLQIAHCFEDVITNGFNFDGSASIFKIAGINTVEKN